MRKIFILTVILLITLITAVFLVPYILTNENVEANPFYIGVTYTGNSVSDAKLLVDRVKNYTNLLVVQSLNFGRNETALTEICDYAVAQNLSIIVNLLNAAHVNSTLLIWQLPFLENAEQRWGNRFLGVYFDDEPGGIQLDYDWASFFAKPYSAGFARLFPGYDANDNESTTRDYTAAARLFTNIIKFNLRPDKWKDAGVTSFTSDYGLYWWDYLGGYDVMLAQLGRTPHTIVQEMALVRGAARMQNRTWGTIITWKYDEWPYLDSPENIYQQLLISYEAGAQYTVIFNYPPIEGNPYGILTDEYFDKLEQFWNDVMVEHNRQAFPDYSQAEAVLVLPSNYGWGMRRPDDRIWGFWGPDEKSPQIWEISRELLSQYDLRLDIVFDDPEFPVAGKYPQVYYWNQTT